MAKDKAKKSKPNGEDASPQKRGLIGTLAAPLLIFGAAFGANWFIPVDPPAAVVSDPSEVSEGAENSTKAAGQPTFDAQRPSTSYPITPIVISVGDRGRTLRLGASLELIHGELNPDDPRLRDAFMTYLRAIDPSNLSKPGFHNEMKRQLLHRARVALEDSHGRDAVYGILITDFYLGVK